MNALLTALLLAFAAPAAAETWTASGCCSFACPGGSISDCGSESFGSQAACNARTAQGSAICNDYLPPTCSVAGFSLTWTCSGGDAANPFSGDGSPSPFDPFGSAVGGPGSVAAGGIADGGSTGARIGGGLYNFGAINLTSGEFGRPFLSRHYSTDFADRYREFQQYLRHNEANRGRKWNEKDLWTGEFGEGIAKNLSQTLHGNPRRNSTRLEQEGRTAPIYSVPGRAPDGALSVGYQVRFFTHLHERTQKPGAEIRPKAPTYEQPAPPPAQTQGEEDPIQGGGTPVSGPGVTQGAPDKAPLPSPEVPQTPQRQGQATGQCRDRNWFFNPETQMCYPTRDNCFAVTNNRVQCTPSK